MKKTIVICCTIFFFVSCTNRSNENTAAIPSETNSAPVAEPDEAVEKKVNYPLEASLASDWKIGNPEHSISVLSLYKSFVDGMVPDSSAVFFADSLTSISYDNSVFKGTGLEFIARVNKFRSQFKTLDEEIISFVPLYSPSQDINQVSLWVKEKITKMDGKRDSTIYQENWRFDKAGKINHRSVFARYSF